MRMAIQQPEHAPWAGFFHKMLGVDLYVFLDHVQFKKRYFENRNKIRTAQGWTWVTVPAQVKGRYTQAINAVEIAPDDAWRRKYWGRLLASYAKAPQGRDLLAWVGEEWLPAARGRLLDMNLGFIRKVCELLDIATPTALASELVPAGPVGSDLILALCRAAGAHTYVSGPDGGGYLDQDAFRRAGVALEFHEFRHPTYPQMHGGEFLSHMSALDMLFNCGAPGARKLLEETA